MAFLIVNRPLTNEQKKLQIDVLYKKLLKRNCCGAAVHTLCCGLLIFGYIHFPVCPYEGSTSIGMIAVAAMNFLVFWLYVMTCLCDSLLFNEGITVIPEVFILKLSNANSLWFMVHCFYFIFLAVILVVITVYAAPLFQSINDKDDPIYEVIACSSFTKCCDKVAYVVGHVLIIILWLLILVIIILMIVYYLVPAIQRCKREGTCCFKKGPPDDDEERDADVLSNDYNTMKSRQSLYNNNKRQSQDKTQPEPRTSSKVAKTDEDKGKEETDAPTDDQAKPERSDEEPESKVKSGTEPQTEPASGSQPKTEEPETEPKTEEPKDSKSKPASGGEGEDEGGTQDDPDKNDKTKNEPGEETKPGETDKSEPKESENVPTDENKPSGDEGKDSGEDAEDEPKEDGEASKTVRSGPSDGTPEKTVDSGADSAENEDKDEASDKDGEDSKKTDEKSKDKKKK